LGGGWWNRTDGAPAATATNVLSSPTVLVP
jgi:hypothetical protein